MAAPGWLAQCLQQSRQTWSEDAMRQRLVDARASSFCNDDAEALLRQACRGTSLLARLEKEDGDTELCLPEYIETVSELIWDLASLHGVALDAALASREALRLLLAVFEDDASPLTQETSPGSPEEARLELVLSQRWGPGGGFHGMHFLHTHTLGVLADELFEHGSGRASGAGLSLKAAENTRHFFLELLIGLAWADKQLTHGERKLIQEKIGGAGLSKRKEKSLQRALLRNKLTTRLLVQVPRAAKQLILEQMLLLSMIDGDLSDEEWEYLVQVAEELEVSAERLMELRLRLAVYFESRQEYFNRLSHVSRLGKTRHFFNNLLDRARRTLTKPVSVRHIQANVKKSLGKLTTEIRETVELNKLLLKATRTPLTKEEAVKVKAQLLDIAKTIPSLAIFALPGGAVLLPVLIKVLPFNILPSAFAAESAEKS